MISRADLAKRKQQGDKAEQDGARNSRHDQRQDDLQDALGERPDRPDEHLS